MKSKHMFPTFLIFLGCSPEANHRRMRQATVTSHINHERPGIRFEHLAHVIPLDRFEIVGVNTHFQFDK